MNSKLLCGICITIAFFSTFSGATESIYYGEVGVGPLTYKSDAGSVKPIAARFIAGRDVHENLSVEAMLATTVKKDDSNYTGGTFSTSGYGIFLKPKYNILNDTFLFARIGYAKAELKGEFANGVTMTTNAKQAARKVGFNSGIVVPANSPNGRSRLGVLYLGSDNPNYFNEESLQCTKLILRAMSAELLDWWTKQSRQELLQRTSLRIDEIELLRFTHEGLRAKEIAEAVGMSKAAVDQKLSRLSARFGTSSKKVASNIAFEHGLLS